MTEAASEAGRRPRPVRPRRRTAVVFVHGQGEQTPMTDVVQLALSVWRTDPRADGGTLESIFKADVAAERALAPVYSVPVYDQDSSDQRRIVTRIVDGAQVDFYQFYWADLMQGSRFTHLWRWFAGLMKRDPAEVPGQLWVVRQLAMAIALAVGLWGVSLGLLTAARLGWGLWPAAGALAEAGADAWAQGWRWLALAGIGGAVTAAAWRLRLRGGAGLGRSSPVAWLAWLSGLGAAALGGLGASAAAVAAFGLNGAGLLAAALLIAAVWGASTLLHPSRRAQAFSVGGGLVAASTLAGLAWTSPHAAGGPAWLAAAYGPAQFLTLAAVLASVLFFWWLNSSFLTPVMTDSARMFSNSPVNVPNQNRIRERGMQLLEALHDPQGERRYDRVVVLAHSLGTVVAYRLLAHYWGKVQPRLDFNNAAAAAQCEGLQAAADQLAAAPQDQDALLAWREAVRAYGAALNSGPRARRRWLITDFVTIGAPLTYAKVLMGETDQAFLDDVQLYKRHPTSPPQPRGTDGSFFDNNWLHHAAPFAVTCWTNLFFPPHGLGGGDMVGGPVRGEPPDGLGHGVLDVSLAHDRTVKGFAHNDYWLWPRGEAPRVAPWEPGAERPHPAPHVAALRDALGLFHATPEEARAADGRLGDPARSYPNPDVAGAN